ncbi:MAG: polysaccharide deacetylase family protein [Ktedonobacterales bacterium]
MSSNGKQLTRGGQSGDRRHIARPLEARGAGIVVSLALTFALMMVSLSGCGERSQPSVVQASGIDHALSAMTPLPTATPVPDPDAARNAALGCTPHAPAPQPQLLYPGVRPGWTGAAPKEIALTFDDGPTPDTSPPIFDILEKTHTPATFFVEGQYIQQWPDLLKREWHDNFAIAVHTWDHPLMSQQSDAQLRHQFGDTVKQIRTILGPNTCVWIWRPPYADYNQHVLDVAASYGLTTITWDDSSLDYTLPGVKQIVDNVLASAHPGAVVLMHDGPAQREQTAAALPAILDGLKARELTPVTLPKLLADGHYPGVSVQDSTASTT